VIGDVTLGVERPLEQRRRRLVVRRHGDAERVRPARRIEPALGVDAVADDEP
jgi:hypothetical protein